MSAIKAEINLVEPLNPTTLARLLLLPEVTRDLDLASSGPVGLGKSGLAIAKAVDNLVKLGLASDLPSPAEAPPPVPPTVPAALKIVGGGRVASKPSESTAATVIDDFTLADVKEEEYPWLWQGRIPARDLSLIMGPMDSGKSHLLTYIAAEVTKGARFPDAPKRGAPPEPAEVLILQTEENVGTTFKKRALRFGAVPSRMRFIRGMKQGSTRLPFNLAAHTLQFETYLAAHDKIKLVVLDPISGYVGGADGNSDTAMRAMLTEYVRIAWERRIAILGIMHMNKDEAKSLINRGNGSGAFLQVPRMVWYLARNPDDAESRLLTLVKGNPEDKIRTGLCCRLADKKIVWDDKPVTMSAQDVADRLEENRNLARQAYSQLKQLRRPQTERPLAMAFIRQYLAKGPKTLIEAKKAAEAEGFKSQTFRNALKELCEPGDDSPPVVEKIPLKGRRFELRLKAVAPAPSTALVLLSDLEKWSNPFEGANSKTDARNFEGANY